VSQPKSGKDTKEAKGKISVISVISMWVFRSRWTKGRRFRGSQIAEMAEIFRYWLRLPPPRSTKSIQV